MPNKPIGEPNDRNELAAKFMRSLVAAVDPQQEVDRSFAQDLAVKAYRYADGFSAVRKTGGAKVNP